MRMMGGDARGWERKRQHKTTTGTMSQSGGSGFGMGCCKGEVGWSCLSAIDAICENGGRLPSPCMGGWQSRQHPTSNLA